MSADRGDTGVNTPRLMNCVRASRFGMLVSDENSCLIQSIVALTGR